MGCPPEDIETQDCREVTVTESVGVACVNYECLTFAISPDASASGDAGDGG
jgi:hypothetical protein